MVQKRIPVLLKVFPRARGALRLTPVLLGAILLGIVAGNFGTGSNDPGGSSGSPAGGTDRPVKALTELPAPADAAGTREEPPETLPGLLNTPSLTGVWVTLFVFMLIGVTTVVLLTRGRRFRAGNGSLHVVDTIPLGGRRLIHLIRCGERKYLIGNSEKGIHYLASLPGDPLEREVERVFDQDAGEASFQELLGQGRERA